MAAQGNQAPVGARCSLFLKTRNSHAGHDLVLLVVDKDKIIYEMYGILDCSFWDYPQGGQKT